MKPENYTYPCTGYINMQGFGAFLETETGVPRRNLRLFAEELCKTLVCEYLILVNSGSSANLVAAVALAEKCRTAGLPLKAVASAFTFPTTLSSLLMAGFEVHLIDVEKNGFNIDVDKLEQNTQPVSVIAVTHFLGFPCDIERIGSYAEKKGCFILLDACETFGPLDICGKGSDFNFTGIATLSFYHPHHLSSYGGGAVICTDRKDYIICDSIAHWGRSCKCHIDERLCIIPNGPAHQFTYERLGLNVEMSELNACFGRWQLRRWEEYEATRRRNYRILYKMLCMNDNLQVWEPEENKSSRFVFPIRLQNGINVWEAWELLSPQGVEIRTLMGGATCSQPAFDKNITHDGCAEAIRMSETTFFVGIHQTLSEENVISVARIINKTFTSRL